MLRTALKLTTTNDGEVTVLDNKSSTGTEGAEKFHCSIPAADSATILVHGQKQGSRMTTSSLPLPPSTSRVDAGKIRRELALQELLRENLEKYGLFDRAKAFRKTSKLQKSLTQWTSDQSKKREGFGRRGIASPLVRQAFSIEKTNSCGTFPAIEKVETIDDDEEDPIMISSPTDSTTANYTEDIRSPDQLEMQMEQCSPVFVSPSPSVDLYTCTLCSQQLANRNELKCHLSIEHVNLAPYRCELCQFLPFATEKSIYEHWEKQHPSVAGTRDFVFVRKRLDPQSAMKKAQLRRLLKLSMQHSIAIQTEQSPREEPQSSVQKKAMPSSGGLMKTKWNDSKSLKSLGTPAVDLLTIPAKWTTNSTGNYPVNSIGPSASHDNVYLPIPDPIGWSESTGHSESITSSTSPVMTEDDRTWITALPIGASRRLLHGALPCVANKKKETLSEILREFLPGHVESMIQKPLPLAEEPNTEEEDPEEPEPEMQSSSTRQSIWECGILGCGFQTEERDELHNHYRLDHDINKKKVQTSSTPPKTTSIHPNICQFCGTQFLWLTSYRAHMVKGCKKLAKKKADDHKAQMEGE